MLSRNKQQVAKSQIQERLRLAPDFVHSQRHTQNGIVPRKAAIATLIDALVREIQGGKQTHDPAESLPGDLIRAKAQWLQEIRCRGRYQMSEIFERMFPPRHALSDGCQGRVERNVDQSCDWQGFQLAHKTHNAQ